MPAAIAGIAEEKEDYNYIHMNFDLFCPAVWMVFKFGCCSRFSQRETAPPPSSQKNSKQHVDINKLETILTNGCIRK